VSLHIVFLGFWSGYFLKLTLAKARLKIKQRFIKKLDLQLEKRIQPPGRRASRQAV
jgi:hypothetical protein